MTELETKIYISLSTRSRRALKKTKGRFGRKLKDYRPRADLVNRLSQQLGISDTEAYNALLKIREEMLRQKNREF